MKTNLLLFMLLGLTISVTAQNYKQQFTESFTGNDTIAQLAILKQWEKTGKNDPDFYISYFNYYANKSAKEVISIEPSPMDEEEAWAIKDSLSNTVGFINSRVMYEKEGLKLALEYIDKGIATFPDRLDMRFGKTYLLGWAYRYDDFTNEIIETLKQSDKINNKWKWSNNEPVEEPKDFMLSNIQGYIGQLYNSGDDDLLNNMKEISEKVLEYYPETIESLTNLSIVHIINEDYTNAIEWLKKAEKLAPEDFIVLGNIALCYKMLGDTEKALKYYELVVKHGDDEAKDFAARQIEKLKQ